MGPDRLHALVAAALVLITEAIELVSLVPLVLIALSPPSLFPIASLVARGCLVLQVRLHAVRSASPELHQVPVPLACHVTRVTIALVVLAALFVTQDRTVFRERLVVHCATQEPLAQLQDRLRAHIASL